MAGQTAGRLNIEIVAEIARLQQDLDKAKRAVNAASKDIAASARHANDNLAGMAGGIAKAGNNSKLANHHLANLSFQIQDIAVGLQGGQKPMTVFLQQGSQIAQIMAQAGVGVGGLAKAVGGMAVGFVKAHPYLVAAGIAAGGAAAAMKLFTAQVNAERKAELEAYAQSLGLTAEELEKVGGAVVTSADMLGGFFDTFEERVPQIKSLFTDFTAFLGDQIRWFVLDAKKNVSEIYGAFVGTVEGVKHVWKNIGPILGEAVIAGANIAIGALEKLINVAIDGINKVAFLANPLLVAAKMAGVDMSIGHVSFGRLSNPYSGAGRDAAGAFQSGFQRGMKESQAAFDRFMGDWADAGVDRAKGRLATAAEEAGKETGKKAGKAAGKSAAESMAAQWAADLNAEMMKNLGTLEAQLKLWRDATLSYDGFGEIAGDLAISQKLRIATVEAERLEKAWQDWNDELAKTADYLQQIGGIGNDLGNILGVIHGVTSGDFSGVGGKLGGVIGLFNQTEFGKDFLKDLSLQFREMFGENSKFLQGLGNVFANAGFGAGVGSIVGGGKAGQLGGMVGGAVGGEIGGSISALGKFGGPIGTIVGSILGSVLGGLMKSTPRGKATFSGGTDYSLSGNSSSRRAAAGSLAGGAVDALQQIADALGVTLGGFTGTIGIRKDSLRYDPTGSGITKTSKGAMDFGQDEAALLEALVADAIRDGAFQGLSEGMKAYLTSGDLEQRLQNVLSFQGVFDELAQRKDPQAYELEQLDKWRANMDTIFADVGASAEQLAQLEELTALKRLEIIKQFTEDAVSFERERRALEIQIMEMEGKTAEALAAARALELEEADASLRPLMERIYALQDEQAAAAIAAEAQAEAARLAEEAAARQRAIAQERYGLETQLLQLQGDIATLRQRELDALDPTNRALQQQIYDMQDAAVAAQELAQAQAEAARAAEELAAQERAIAQERYGLETRLLQLQGDVAALRERELEALAPANRALLETIFALEDTQAAAAVAAQAAEELAAQQKAIADERYGLETRLLQLQGDVAALRARELEALDPSNRALLELIHALEDQQAATASAAQAAEELAAKTRAIADERYGLETRLLQLQGDTAALRQRELEALDPSNRALLAYIHTLEDAATAAEEAARVAEEAAAAERALREERAAIARQNFATSVGLMADIAELEGRTRDALILRRNEEARAMDASLHPLLARKYALEDEALAAQQAAQAAEEAARAAQELAAKMQAIAQERYQLETRLLQLQGNTAELRRREMAELDPSNRAILAQIHALEDQQAAAAAMVDQNNALIQSYNSSASSIESLRDRFAGFASDIRLYRASLFGDTAVSARSNFSRIASMAALGDEASLQGFTGAADAYLAEARNSARTLVDYRRAVGLVAGAADKAAAGADGVVRMAEAQLAGIQSSVMQLQALNAQIEADSKIAQDQAVEQLRQAQEIERAQDDTVEVIEAGTDMLADRLAEVASALAEIKAQLASDGASERVENTAMVVSLGRIDDLLRGVEEGGTLRVSGVSDLPVYTEAAP